jgi:two-component system response regulator LytT
MNCIVIDDERTARAIIGQLCHNTNNIKVIKEFPDALQAVKFIEDNDVDLVFLDINMPNFNGFDFMKTLKNPPRIILTTSDVNFAIEAFEFECVVDYLVKPILLPRFEKAILKFQKFKTNKIKDSSHNEAKEVLSPVNHLYVNVTKYILP